MLTRGGSTLLQAKLEGPAVIDLRSLPPNVAEVYVLTIMQKLQRRCRITSGHPVCLGWHM